MVADRRYEKELELSQLLLRSERKRRPNEAPKRTDQMVNTKEEAGVFDRVTEATETLRFSGWSNMPFA